jgi:flagellar protein FliL
MKIAIIIVVVLVLLGGGGAATWFLVLKEDPEAKPEEAPIDAVAFIEMDSLNVPVIKNGVIQRYVLLRVTLDMRDGEARTLALAAMPKLRDRFINDLYGYFENLPASEKGVNIKTIKRRMLRTSNAVLGADAVRDILILGVFERPWKATK